MKAETQRLSQIEAAVQELGDHAAQTAASKIPYRQWLGIGAPEGWEDHGELTEEELQAIYDRLDAYDEWRMGRKK